MGGISALASEPELADTLRIGLQDAILLGLKNNPTVAVKRLEPKIMETYVKEQKGFFDPALEISGTQSQNKSQRLLGTRPTPVELQDNRSNYSLQISEILPTGTAVTASTGMTGALSNLYTDQFSGTIGLTVTQPLLKGFGFGVNLASL